MRNEKHFCRNHPDRPATWALRIITDLVDRKTAVQIGTKESKPAKVSSRFLAREVKYFCDDCIDTASNSEQA